ncbi:MAG: RpiB/LacA/LacB family sugar-phosphate isomerase [Actinobacteria bacterium]|nr:RpiB/LacA/LacB family sugar-phosphate isomerase [Actinomycetota bacterium]NBO07641.1 RpiB/LacA/LacB family sugar-phosphate isomerase [Actinomycetota bacterium]NBO47170.1 RpiB/LacA/LacB family sugar-phosphate isomerase [Actinomycetota bacterium]NBP11893.1 RpiB/LacA/LacB family sugar-phosphate isomerase [Actinomycetota bacterium]NBP22002.1 RpiB/LacA/LacB family sugar-phosphate isomerase [Actinomycetota bacterium]
MRVVVGCDSNGLALKRALIEILRNDPRTKAIDDLGVHGSDDATVYPEIGFALAQAIAEKKAERGLLICGTGIGMAISANKVAGIRAATTHDPYSLERAILSNNCQIICMGAKVITVENAAKLIEQWLGYEFDTQSASQVKVERINSLEAEHRK